MSQKGEKIGSGMKRMRDICKKENAPYPKIDYTDIHFYIVFKQSREYLKMAKAEEKVGEKVTEKGRRKGHQKRWPEKVGRRVGRRVGRKSKENIRFGENKSPYF